MASKQATYNLEHVVVNFQKNTVRVHLHGHKRGWVQNKRIERITLNIVQGMTEQEAIRCAAFMSPNKWVIPWLSTLARYRKKWNAPLEARLQKALTDPDKISASMS